MSYPQQQYPQPQYQPQQYANQPPPQYGQAQYSPQPGYNAGPPPPLPPMLPKPPRRRNKKLMLLVSIVVVIVVVAVLAVVVLMLMTPPFVGKWKITSVETTYGTIAYDGTVEFRSDGTGSMSVAGSDISAFSWKDMGNGKVSINDGVCAYSVSGNTLRLTISGYGTYICERF